jgi:hypothetical protein
MRRIILVTALILGSMFSAGGQSEQGAIEPVVGPRSRVIFVFRPTAHSINCPSIDMTAITPDKTQRMEQTIFAEALVYGNTVGYVFWIVNSNGPHEVYLATYTLRDCSLDEAQIQKRTFVEGTRFNEARVYYRSLLNEVSK